MDHLHTRPGSAATPIGKLSQRTLLGARRPGQSTEALLRGGDRRVRHPAAASRKATRPG
jgi:hypothetical protein